MVNVYKVIFDQNHVVAAIPESNLQHCDIGLSENNEDILWLALECEDEQTAMEIGEVVIKTIWK